MAEKRTVTVFYDGACPLCRREIAFYRGRKGAECVLWQDLSRMDDPQIEPGLTKEQALARFHVRNADGVLVSGGYAFVGLWSALPGFRLLVVIFRMRPLAWLLDRLYNGFLRIRPLLQSLVS